MIPVYKKVKVALPHCSVCGQMLMGNNSYASPYCCPCGEWKMVWTDDHKNFEYELNN